MPYIDQNKCNQCEECIFTCPNNAINFFEGKLVIDQEKCKTCNNCVVVCPQEAIRKSNPVIKVGLPNGVNKEEELCLDIWK